MRLCGQARTAVRSLKYLLRSRRSSDTGPFLATVRTLVMAVHVRPRGRVLVVDDDPLVCDLVTSTLAEHGYYAQRAADAREALYLVGREPPDVVVLDVRLPDISGYQVCRRLRDDYGDAIGIILISGERIESFDRVAGMLLGADDYMVKPFVLDELLARVQRLAKRSRPIARTVVAGLTRRELEILRLLACGMDHIEIARDLVITPKTVEKHIEHILLKLGVHSRAQAIALALQQEAVDEPTVVSLMSIDGGRKEAVN
ncbi:MAG: response regulator transcription factor [Chloroflexi bacterium]|nr:MAG: response regulator transcription factor [Chloroflexota bacterium]